MVFNGIEGFLTVSSSAHNVRACCDGIGSATGRTTALLVRSWALECDFHATFRVQPIASLISSAIEDSS